MEDKLQVNNKEELQAIIDAYPTRLRRGLVAITTNTVDVEDEETFEKGKTLLSEQYIVAVGDLVKDLQPGDKVDINVDAMFTVKRYANNSDETFVEFNAKTKEVNGYELAIVDERIIEQIYK